MKRYTKRTAFRFHPMMPPLLAEAQRRVRTFEDQPYKYFPDLALPAGHVKTTYIQKRRKIVTTMCTYLACMDIRRRHVGYPVPDTDPPKFRFYTNAQLIKRSGDGMYRRAWQRAMLAARRYLGVKPRSAGNDEDGHVGFAPIRWVYESLFHRTGLYEKWVAACEQADKFLRSGAGDKAATAELISEGAIVPPAKTATPDERMVRLHAESVERGKIELAALAAKFKIDTS